jgi:hypothetical protein
MMYHNDTSSQGQAADIAMTGLYRQLDDQDLPGELPFDTAAGLRDLARRVQDETRDTGQQRRAGQEHGHVPASARETTGRDPADSGGTGGWERYLPVGEEGSLRLLPRRPPFPEEAEDDFPEEAEDEDNDPPALVSFPAGSLAEVPGPGRPPEPRPPAGGAPQEVTIGMWGAPGSGKSTFLAALPLAAIPRDLGRWVVYPGNEITASLMVESARALVAERRFPAITMPGSTTEVCMHFVGDLAGSRFDRRRLLRRRAPLPERFILTLADVSGEAFGHDLGYRHMSSETQKFADDRLAAAQGLLYFFDPLGERDHGNSMEYLNRAIIDLSRRMLTEGRLVSGYLPHYVSVCITKFDHPDVARQAQRLGLVTYGPDGMPQVTGKNAKTLFDAICEGTFWEGRHKRSALSALFVRDQLKNRFHPDRTRYFVTSAIGFYPPPSGSAAGRRPAFDPADCVNFHEEGGQQKIRGPVTPIGVLESVLSLQRGICGATNVRTLRAVPSEYAEEKWRRRA